MVAEQRHAGHRAPHSPEMAPSSQAGPRTLAPGVLALHASTGDAEDTASVTDSNPAELERVSSRTELPKGT